MKLMTKELEKKFEIYPLYSQDGKMGDAQVVAKFFNPCGAGTWLITEASKEGDDWIMFGYCHLGDNEMAELGYVSLNELQSFKSQLFGLGIERDLYYPESINLRDACKREFNFVPDILKEKAKFTILQLKDGEENHLLRFANYQYVTEKTNGVDALNYDNVYSGEWDYYINMNDISDVVYTREQLYCMFNRDNPNYTTPDDFKGHSLSVSDVIILSCEGIEKAYYVDSIGFKELPTEFVNKWNELQIEQEAEKDITDKE